MLERVENKALQIGSLESEVRPCEPPIEKMGKLTGHSKHYRGNHRSSNRGAGFRAFMRNKWMKNCV